MILALVGQWREEAGAQVAVRIVHLQPLVARIERAHRGVGVRLVDALDLVDAELLDRVDVAATAIGNVGRRDYRAFPFRQRATISCLS